MYTKFLFHTLKHAQPPARSFNPSFLCTVHRSTCTVWIMLLILCIKIWKGLYMIINYVKQQRFMVISGSLTSQKFHTQKQKIVKYQSFWFTHTVIPWSRINATTHAWTQTMEACRNEQVVFSECQQGFEEEINNPSPLTTL